MNVKTKIAEKDFILVNYQLLWMKPIIKVLIAFSSFLIAYEVYYTIQYPDFYDRNMILYIGLIVFWIVMIWWVARRNYRTNKRIQENLTYTIEADKLMIAGESFKVELSWDKVFRVIKTKKWVLVFQSRQSANLISRNECSEEVMNKLKSVCSQNNIKNNL
jgi:hypothetical protein